MSILQAPTRKIWLAATVGNTLGGALDWWMGYGAHQAADRWKHSQVHVRALDWLERLGPE